MSLERWPGYNEQSWHERFLELDRRLQQANDRLVLLAASKALCRPSVVEVGEYIPDLTDEQFAAIQKLTTKPNRIGPNAR